MREDGLRKARLKQCGLVQDGIVREIDPTALLLKPFFFYIAIKGILRNTSFSCLSKSDYTITFFNDLIKRLCIIIEIHTVIITLFQYVFLMSKWLLYDRIFNRRLLPDRDAMIIINIKYDLLYNLIAIFYISFSNGNIQFV